MNEIPTDPPRGQRGNPNGSGSEYSEVLRPGASMWVAMVCFALLIGAALVPAGLIIAIIGFVVVLALGMTALVVSSQTIRVSNGTLSVGRKSVPLDSLDPSFLNQSAILRRRAARVEVGQGRDPMAFVCFRSSIATAVKLPITAPHDETPYWIISTRSPENLINALTATNT